MHSEPLESHASAVALELPVLIPWAAGLSIANALRASPLLGLIGGEDHQEQEAVPPAGAYRDQDLGPPQVRPETLAAQAPGLARVPWISAALIPELLAEPPG